MVTAVLSHPGDRKGTASVRPIGQPSAPQGAQGSVGETNRLDVYLNYKDICTNGCD